MKLRELFEGVGRIVPGVNTTPDVGPDQVSKEAAKFGFKVDKDGVPPTLSKKVKGKSTNVLFNLGLSESINYKLYNEALGEIASATEIYVDMDGVLADFFGNWAKLMNVDHFSDIPKQHDMDDALQKIRDTENFWLDLPLTSNAKNLLGLIKKVKGSYKILSSPLPGDPNSEPHKREWIEKHLGFFPPEDVIITHDKAKYATQEDGTPNILIDDYGVNISKWEAAGGYGFKHKNHKFERTAKNIEKHMKEPVEETIQEVDFKSGSYIPMTSNPNEMVLANVAQASGITGVELAAFMSQMAHESEDFKDMVEDKPNIKRYTSGHTAKILGNKSENDAKRFVGRGFIQLTGRWNYEWMEKELGIDLTSTWSNAHKAADPTIAAKIAVVFWKSRVRPKVSDWSDVKQVTAPINPKLHGIGSRATKFKDSLKSMMQTLKAKK